MSVHVGCIDEEVPLPLGQRPPEEDRVAGVRGGLGVEKRGKMREIHRYIRGKIQKKKVFKSPQKRNYTGRPVKCDQRRLEKNWAKKRFENLLQFGVYSLQ